MDAQALLDTLDQAETEALDELTPFRGGSLASYEAERIVMKLVAKVRQHLLPASTATEAAAELPPAPVSVHD